MTGTTRRPTAPLLRTLAAGLLLAGAAGAQTADAETDADATPLEGLPGGADEPGDIRIGFGARSTYTFEGDLDEGDGDVAIWRAAARLTLDRRVSDDMSISLSFGHESSGYEFSGFDSIVPGADSDPFDAFHEQRLSLGVVYRIDERWILFASPGVGIAYESGADAGEAVTFGGIVAVGYQVNDRLRIGGGVSVSSEIEDNARVLPIFNFDWQISDRWRLTNDDRLRFLNEQIGLNLIYEHDDSFSALLALGYQTRRYRLADDSTVARDGVMDDDRLVLGLAGQWDFNGRGSLRIGAGAVLYQEFLFEDDGGSKIEEFETDPAAFVGARVTWDF